MNSPLHPNLARLAASYDDIFVRWSRGSIDAEQARMEIAALVARDDDGILWSIDPDSGQWMRRTVSGNLVPGEPPTYGLATPTPHDLSGRAGSFNPDAFVNLQPVDDELLYAPSTLAGSTRRPRVDYDVTGGSRRRWSIVAVAIVVAVAVAYLATTFVGGGGDQAPEIAPVQPAD